MTLRVNGPKSWGYIELSIQMEIDPVLGGPQWVVYWSGDGCCSPSYIDSATLSEIVTKATTLDDAVKLFLERAGIK